MILAGLMRRYRDRVPDVERIIAAMVDHGIVATAADIDNDHIAFRTMAVAHLGIASLEKVFLHHGYRRRDRYAFAQKYLDAYWYSPPRRGLPRVFISELRVRELPDNLQAIITAYTDTVITDPVDRLDLDDPHVVDDFLHRPLWPLPTWSHYRQLQQGSEYAAWVIFNRYYLNHFTISVHALAAQVATIGPFNEFLQHEVGVDLNDTGGVIKVSADGLLRQSSTVAQLIPARFADGDVHPIPGSYVEFAERLRLLDSDARRDGFEAANADRIFESTDTRQIRSTPGAAACRQRTTDRVRSLAPAAQGEQAAPGSRGS
jgi:hypothetical protein